MRFLIVDDNPADRELVRIMLECRGHSVWEGADGLEGLEVLEREKVDAIVSDVLMPRMDGYRFCSEVRKTEKFRAVPFVFYSSSCLSPQDEQAVLAKGADKFLRKPLSAQELVQALQEAVERAPNRPSCQLPAVQELDLMREYNQRLVQKLEEEHQKLEAETAALQRTQQTLHHVLGLCQAVIYSLKSDDEQFRVSWISENVSQLLGFSPEEACQAEWWWTQLHPEDRDAVKNGRPRLLSDSRVALEYRFRRKDGKYVWLRDEQRMVWDASGKPVEIIGTAVDITDVRKLEELLRQSQKMEAVGRLAGGVAHDFNNLLAVIRGNIELTLMEGEQLSRDGQACLQAATTAVDSASGMIRQLLTFSRMQVAQTQSLELNGLIGKLVSMLERIMGKDIELEWRCAPDLPLVEADPVMLEQVVINLVVNARDSMPKGGRLRIAMETVKVDQAYTAAHPEACVGEYVALSVTDTGTGIAPEHLPRIFEPFFSTKQASKGTGLGLATVYGIVKQHHGWVEVTTQTGVGSTFRVFLPSKPGKPASVAKMAATGAAGRGNETILLVDDEEGVRSSIRRLLERFGYKVREAASGREALRLWGDQGAEIDLLLTDINMPQGINGLELAEKVRAERRDVKVIYLSGYTEEMPERETGLATNAKSRFLQKPCSSQELIQTVRQSLDVE